MSNGNTLPAEYDHALYVNDPNNADLKDFGPDQAWAHYQTYGRNEGRRCSAVYDRGTFNFLLADLDRLLEVGPGASPSFHRPERNVRYVDAYDTAQLREAAVQWSWVDPERIPDIDYVWSGQPYAATIDASFDAAYGCHSIEHQPCLVRHLNDVADVLPPGGRYFMVVPDKRYNFDYFLHETDLADVLEAHLEGRTRHAYRNLIGHALFPAHNEAPWHWGNNHGPDRRQHLPDPEVGDLIRRTVEDFRVDKGYRDTHAWRFTPDGFRWIAAALRAAGLSRFDVERVYPTQRDSFEFYVVLRRGA